MRISAVAAASVALIVSSVYGHEGWGVVVHDRLGVVVADIPGNTIWRVVGGGAERLRDNIHSHDLVLGPDDAIYGSNPEPSGSRSSVWRIDETGRFSYVLPPAPDSPLGLQSFLLASDGSIYSVNRYDHRRPTVVLLRREPTGEVVTVAGGPTGVADGSADAARFVGIDGIRETANGTLLIADGSHLRTVSRDGHVVKVTGPLSTRRWGEDLLGLSSIREQIVYVADHAGRRVLRVDLKTDVVTEADRSGLFWAPAGVEHRQSLYVLEHLRPPLSLLGDLQIGPYLRVRRVAPGGASVTLAVVWGRRTAWAVVGAISVVMFTTVGLYTKRRRKRAG